MSRLYKFPDPRDRSANEPAVLCPAERVKELYNAYSGSTCQRISATVKTWFDAQARELGWHEVVWLKDVASSHGAGCLMSIAVIHFVPA